jgi:hypothetical protein
MVAKTEATQSHQQEGGYNDTQQGFISVIMVSKSARTIGLRANMTPNWAVLRWAHGSLQWEQGLLGGTEDLGYCKVLCAPGCILFVTGHGSRY